MPTAREIMTPDAEWIDADVTVADAARQLRQRSVGALPVCDSQGHLQGMVTDRDIAVKVVAEERNPADVRVRDLLDGSEVVTIGADDPVEEAIRTMKEHDVRRLPVIDGTEMVGMVSQADIARAMPESRVGDLVSEISASPPNN